MKKQLLSTAIVVAGMIVAGSTMASPVIYNLSLSNISTFDNVITGTGATVITTKVSVGQNTYNYIDKNGNAATVTVTRPSGAAPSFYGQYGSMSGPSWSINPQSNGADPIPGFNSGLKFTFSSPVNAFGFEIGDWATCCTGVTRPANIQSTYGVPAQGSGLWIAFDGGAATLPANALSQNDNPGYVADRRYENFIGAIDSSGFFSSLTFFGDGFGEVLTAGGTLRFASVPQGSVGNDVPEPGSMALLALGLLGLASARRRMSV